MNVRVEGRSHCSRLHFCLRSRSSKGWASLLFRFFWFSLVIRIDADSDGRFRAYARSSGSACSGSMIHSDLAFLEELSRAFAGSTLA